MLEPLARAVGSRASALSRSSDKQLNLLGSSVLEEAFAELKAGRTPPYSSAVLAFSSTENFYSDNRPHLQERLNLVPFYRDFMCPVIDIPWRTSARLCGPSDISGIRLSFWRGRRQGPFSNEEIAYLQTILPSVRVAAAFSERFADGRVLGQSASFRRRGEFVMRFDFAGRVIDDGGTAYLVDGHSLGIVGRRLVAGAPGEQRALDRALGAAVGLAAQPGSVSLTGPEGKRSILLLLPVCGDARDFFSATAALGVVIEKSRPPMADPNTVALLRSAFGLTAREAEICGLTSLGLSPVAIAQAIGVGVGTVRTHLKSAMQKADLHSQVELAALVSRFH